MYTDIAPACVLPILPVLFGGIIAGITMGLTLRLLQRLPALEADITLQGLGPVCALGIERLDLGCRFVP